MEDKKKVIILVIIALILALTAIILNVIDSKEVPTTKNPGNENSYSGQIGVNIEPATVEDKLTKESPNKQK